jgi:hypothetical protein
MRILFWSELFWPYIGGIEVLGMKLLGALRQRGHEVAVATSHGSLPLPDEDTHTRTSPSTGSGSWRPWRAPAWTSTPKRGAAWCASSGRSGPTWST